MKFKVGDVVRIIESDYVSIISNDKCIITHIDHGFYNVRKLNSSLGLYFLEYKLELDQVYMNEQKMKELLGVK